MTEEDQQCDEQADYSVPLDRMVEALVVFGPTNQRYVKPGTSTMLDLWCATTDPKFGHCGLYVKSDRADVFIEVQTWHSATTFDLYTREFLEDALNELALTSVLRVCWPINLRPWRPRLGLTCVSVAKHALGINAPFVFTPRQLYGYLVGMRGVTELLQPLD